MPIKICVERIQSINGRVLGKLALLSLILFHSMIANSQPWNFVSPGNVNMISGVVQNQPNYDNKHRVTLGTNGFSVSASAIFDIKPTNEIRLTPGFKAGAFTTGNAHLQLRGLPVVSFHQNGYSNIPKYDKFEIGIILPPYIQEQIDNFFDESYTGTNKINPYDPAQIRITCQFQSTASSAIFQRPGFYYEDWTTQPVVNQTDKWIKIPNEYKFRIRFAPPLVATYLGTIYIFLNGSSVYSEIASVEFNVTQSSNRGQLNINSVNPGDIQKLRYDDGEIFFGVGMNVAHARNNPFFNIQNSNGNPAFISGYDMSCTDGINTPVCPNAHYEHRIILKGISDNGGNFARVRLDNGSVPIETIDYTIPCPGQLQNKSKYLNNYNHNQMFMWEMDRTLEMCEREGIHLMVNILADWDFNPNATNPSPGVYRQPVWNENPYSAILSQPEDFFSDPVAIEIFKKRLYYLHSRWGYSTSLGIWELINETENMAHYYKNPQMIASWVCQMKGYLQSPDFYPKHPVTNGTVKIVEPPQSNPPYINELTPCIDIASSNAYNDDWNNGIFENSNDWLQTEVLQRHTKYWTNANVKKPYLWGEIGMHLHQADNRSAYCYHSKVWSSIFSNGIGTALMWWSWQNLSNCPPIPGPTFRMNQLSAMRRFTNRINFDQLLLPDKNQMITGWRNGIQYTENENNGVFTTWLRSYEQDEVYGWTWNTSANWSNDFYSDLVCFNPDQNLINTLNSPVALTSENNPGRTDFLGSNTNFVPTPAITFQAAQKYTKVQGLKPNHCYNIDIFDAWSSQNDLLESLTEYTDGSGILRFGRMMPTFSVDVSGHKYYPDYAFIATSCEGSSGEGHRNVQQTETDNLICLDDLYGKIDESYIVNWDFGNGETSQAEAPCMSYSQPGVYTVQVIASSLREGKEIKLDREIHVSPEIRVLPNPASDIVTIYQNNWTPFDKHITITDEMGRIVNSTSISDNTIDVSNLKNGFYLLEIISVKSIKRFKLVIQH